MNNLLTAIATKISGSALSSDVGGRIYFDQYPADEIPPTYPYVVYFIVSGTPADTFNDKLNNVLIQFSLFSVSSGVTEITTMYSDLEALFDDAVLSITGSAHIWTIRQNLTTMVDDIVTADGTQQEKHWAVDYEIMTQEN